MPWRSHFLSLCVRGSKLIMLASVGEVTYCGDTIAAWFAICALPPGKPCEAIGSRLTELMPIASSSRAPAGGLAIFVPRGNDSDATRDPHDFLSTYEMLHASGCALTDAGTS